MTEEQAKKRFAILQISRLFALMLVMAGIANIGGKLLPELSPYLGYGLLLFGALDFFLVPMLLKRAWQNGDK